MDTEDIKLITDLQAKSEERIIGHINGTAKGVRAKIESEVNRIDEMDKLRNGRISENEDDIKEIKEETRISRWAHRNPKVAIITVVILIASVSIGLHTVGVKRAVERLMRIELKE